MKKKVAILAIVILTTFNAFAQKKCKFDYDKEDKVTGVHLKFFNYSFELGAVKIQVGNNGSQSYFSFGYTFRGEMNQEISKETDTLFIRLANKELIKLNSKENTKGTSSIDATRRQVYTFYGPVYYLNNDQLKSLSESPMIAFKFSIGGKEYTFEVPDKKSEKIMDGFDCLKQNK